MFFSLENDDDGNSIIIIMVGRYSTWRLCMYGFYHSTIYCAPTTLYIQDTFYWQLDFFFIKVICKHIKRHQSWRWRTWFILSSKQSLKTEFKRKKMINFRVDIRNEYCSNSPIGHLSFHISVYTSTELVDKA